MSFQISRRTLLSRNRYAVDQTVYTQCNINLRRAPGDGQQPAHQIIRVIARGAPLQILAGPVTADRLIWWLVQAPLHKGKSAIGWVAQAAGNGVQLLDIIPPVPITDNDPLGEVPDGTATETFTATEPDSPSTSGGATGESTDESTDPIPAHTLRLARPFVGQWRLSQGWGKRPSFYAQITYGGVPLKGHNGLDFGTPEGTALLAAADGTVSRIGWEPKGFGNYLILTHAWGESLYAHLEQIDVTKGAKVAVGEPLGLTGNSGLSTAPHLHFGIRIAPYHITDGWGGFSDPTPFLDLIG